VSVRIHSLDRVSHIVYILPRPDSTADEMM
jgi:hypothetical protein